MTKSCPMCSAPVSVKTEDEKSFNYKDENGDYRTQTNLGTRKYTYTPDTIFLKGKGKVQGDGWKDTTTIGETIFVWNNEMAPPYAPGQYPRVDNPTQRASVEQYDFVPATAEEMRTLLSNILLGGAQALDYLPMRNTRSRESANNLREAMEFLRNKS